MEGGKRQHDEVVGPTIGPTGPKKKKGRSLEFESFFLSQLPTSALYERSYMHRDVATHVEVSSLDFVITGLFAHQYKEVRMATLNSGRKIRLGLSLSNYTEHI